MSFISLGTAGQIEDDGQIAGAPPRSLVRFTGEAIFSAKKVKFGADGEEETRFILTIDPKSFQVVAVANPTAQQLDLLDQTAGPEEKAP